MTSCWRCETGSFSLQGAIQCTKCEPGRYASSVGASSCLDCPAGTFATADGSTACEACPLGTATSQPARAECQPCEADHVADAIGMVQCRPIPVGYCANRNRTAATPCGSKSGLRFVILKGTTGWGDRLQCLLQAIKYARSSGRYLVIDWRDVEWSHDGRLNFVDFFDLAAPTMSWDSFLTWWIHNDYRASITPPIWRYHMDRVDFKDLLYKLRFHSTNSARQISQIANFELDDFEEDVVVYAGVGYRAFAFVDFASIRPNLWVARNLNDFALQHNLTRHGYDVVHIRAGSKSWAGGDVHLKDLKQRIDAKFPTAESYFSHLRESLTKARQSTPNPLPLFVLSDSASVSQQFINFLGEGTYLTHIADSKLSGSGIHQLSSKDLEGSNISKLDINLAGLRDFAVMLNARHIAWDNVSEFSKMASNCRNHIDARWRFPSLDSIPN